MRARADLGGGDLGDGDDARERRTGFGVSGPMGSFAGLADASTAVLIDLMWMGRLQLLPRAASLHAELLARLDWTGLSGPAALGQLHPASGLGLAP